MFDRFKFTMAGAALAALMAPAAMAEECRSARKRPRPEAIVASDVDALSKTGLRTALGALGLPTSGKLEGMRERLREALLGEDKDQWD